jgi:hypothetical protein
LDDLRALAGGRPTRACGGLAGACVYPFKKRGGRISGAYVDGVPDPKRDVLISLCERVLSAQMTLEEFERTWPEPVENAPLAPLREALEDGIEHTPGYLFRRGVNIQAWQRSPEYADIVSHLRQLREATD